MIRKVQLLLLASPLVRLYPAVRRAWQISRYVLRRPVTHGEDFAAFARFAPRPGLFLDVGASSGTSAMSFRVFNRRNRILSIEPNGTLEDELRFLKRIVRGFDYRIAAAGDRRGTVTMYVPFYRGVALTAYTASSREDVVDERGGLRDWLGDRMNTPEFSVQEVTAEMLPLDDLDLSPAFIKIDVEGSELRVLRGLAATLDRCKPVLLVERSGEFEAIQQLLELSGYAAYSYQADVGRFVPFASDRAGGPNVFFIRSEAVPRDAVDRRRSRRRRAGRGRGSLSSPR